MAKKLAKDRLYLCKREEEIADEFECTFKPAIQKSQIKVQGRRQNPIFEPMLTDEIIEEKIKQKIEKEMSQCTFKPFINKKSLIMVDNVNKRKEEEQQKNMKKVEDIYPMKQIIERSVNNKASMFFDVQNNKGIEKLALEKENFHSKKKTESINKDLIVKNDNLEVETMKFDNIRDSDEELPLPPEMPDSEDNKHFEQLVKYVIFDNELYSSPNFPQNDV